MQSSPPLVVVLAGPNGAGKSTGAARLLWGTLAVEEFVNADTIASGISAYRAQDVAVAAGRIMLERLDFLARERLDFAFETTLAGRGHYRRLQVLGDSGYRRHLVFLSLPDADLAVARVSERVREGGHDVPDHVVRRRFAWGLRNLLGLYLEAVDSWQVYDNSGVGEPRLLAAQAAHGEPRVSDADAWEHLQEVAR